MRFPTLAKDEIHRPIVALRLQGPTGRWANIDVLVDTGSDVDVPGVIGASLGN